MSECIMNTTSRAVERSTAQSDDHPGHHAIRPTLSLTSSVSAVSRKNRHSPLCGGVKAMLRWAQLNNASPAMAAKLRLRWKFNITFAMMNLRESIVQEVIIPWHGGFSCGC